MLEVVGFLESTGLSSNSAACYKEDGVVRPADVQAALSPDTLLVSLMLANNETGVIQPVGEISRLVKDRQTRYAHPY